MPRAHRRRTKSISIIVASEMMQSPAPAHVRPPTMGDDQSQCLRKPKPADVGRVTSRVLRAGISVSSGVWSSMGYSREASRAGANTQTHRVELQMRSETLQT
jgi:hypothetical protein